MPFRTIPTVVTLTIEFESQADAVSVYELLKCEAKIHAATIRGSDGTEQDLDRYLEATPAEQTKTTP